MADLNDSQHDAVSDILDECDNQGLSPEACNYAHATAYTESGFNHKNPAGVVNVNYNPDLNGQARSHATGLFQLQPSTFNGIVKQHPDLFPSGKGDVTDYNDNIKAGVAHINDLFGKYNNDALKVGAAWHAGEPTASEFLNDPNGYNLQTLPKETNKYLVKLNQAYQLPVDKLPAEQAQAKGWGRSKVSYVLPGYEGEEDTVYHPNNPIGATVATPSPAPTSVAQPTTGGEYPAAGLMGGAALGSLYGAAKAAQGPQPMPDPLNYGSGTPEEIQRAKDARESVKNASQALQDAQGVAQMHENRLLRAELTPGEQGYAKEAAYLNAKDAAEKARIASEANPILESPNSLTSLVPTPEQATAIRQGAKRAREMGNEAAKDLTGAQGSAYSNEAAIKGATSRVGTFLERPGDQILANYGPSTYTPSGIQIPSKLSYEVHPTNAAPVAPPEPKIPAGVDPRRVNDLQKMRDAAASSRDTYYQLAAEQPDAQANFARALKRIQPSRGLSGVTSSLNEGADIAGSLLSRLPSVLRYPVSAALHAVGMGGAGMELGSAVQNELRNKATTGSYMPQTFSQAADVGLPAASGLTGAASYIPAVASRLGGSGTLGALSLAAAIADAQRRGGPPQTNTATGRFVEKIPR